MWRPFIANAAGLNASGENERASKPPSGGAGAACAEALKAAGIEVPMLLLGLPDRWVDHGDATKLLAQEGLDAAGMRKSIEARLQSIAPVLKKSA